MTTQDILWSGEVVLDGDYCVPQGSRLILAPGTRIRALGPSNPRHMPLERVAFGELRDLTARDRHHVLVRGSIEACGEPGAQIQFAGDFAVGLLAAQYGRVCVKNAIFRPAGGFAVCSLDFSHLSITRCEFEGGLGGVACGGFSSAKILNCRFSDASKAGIWLHDDAEAKIAGCAIRRNQIGILAQRDSRCWSVDNAITSNRGYGTVLQEAAQLRSRSCLWKNNPIGISSQGRSRVDGRRDRLACNRVGLEAIVRSRVALDRLAASENETAVWVQNRARLRMKAGRCSGNGIGIKTSHAAQARLEGLILERQKNAGVFLEEQSRILIQEGIFFGNGNATLVLPKGSLRTERCRFLKNTAGASADGRAG